MNDAIFARTEKTLKEREPRGVETHTLELSYITVQFYGACWFRKSLFTNQKLMQKSYFAQNDRRILICMQWNFWLIFLICFSSFSLSVYFFNQINVFATDSSFFAKCSFSSVFIKLGGRHSNLPCNIRRTSIHSRQYVGCSNKANKNDILCTMIDLHRFVAIVVHTCVSFFCTILLQIGRAFAPQHKKPIA